MTTDNIKVLMLGHCHSVFINALSTHLKRVRPMRVSVLELLSPGAEIRGLQNPVYDEILRPPAPPAARSKGAAVREVLSDAADQGRLMEILGSLDLGRPLAFPQVLRDRYYAARSAEEWRSLFAKFDIINLHYLDLCLKDVVQFIPDNVPVVLSIWGSDLMDTAGVETYSEHLKICERADIITLRSLAMREIFLSKYGRQFLPKTRLAKFGVGMGDAIDALAQEGARTEFFARHQIDPTRKIVCVGHSGCPRDRHIEVLQSLNKASSQVRDAITLVLPMTYRATPAYIDEVRAEAERSGFDFRILTEYMSAKDVAALRLSSDILVFLPEQDALSSAMCETIYSGNTVITGAWLPYTEFWDLGIEVCRIPDIDAVPDALEKSLFAADSAALEKNRSRVRPLMDYQFSVGGWIAAYDAALLSGRNQPSL